jgi:OPT family oligopeptide transporter
MANETADAKTVASKTPGVFQSPPKNAAELEASRPLSISPEQVLEMDEATWYEKVYRGDAVPQLTVRAVAMGSFLGFFLAFTNLYVGLKTGWGLGVAITACILAFAMSNGLVKLGLAKTPLTILETNCMQSTASAAGYSTGGTMVSAIAALLILSVTEAHPRGEHLPWHVLAGWTIFLAALGTIMAIPMKRNMINQERLKFPSGTAAAVTLQSLYSHGTEAIRKARALMFAALAGVLVPLLIELKLVTTVSESGETERGALFPADVKIFDWLPAPGTQVVEGRTVAYLPSDWTMVWDMNPVMVAAGALVGMRVAVYMLIAGLVLVYGLGTFAIDDLWTAPGATEAVGAVSKPWKAWKEIGLWVGVPIMLSSGLLNFALQWKTIVRAFQGLGASAKKDGASEADDLAARTEVPFSWFGWGMLLASIGVLAVADLYFNIPWYYGAIAISLTFFLSLVACRATGESDITPVGAMGKIMQLTFGVLIPQSTTANLMSASITANVAGSSADLLNDLKSGYLLGANPRRQFIAQFLGIFAGTIATVVGFYLLVPDAVTLTGADLPGGRHVAPEFPAPAAQAWKAVAEVMAGGGLDAMHPTHRVAIFWGLALGAVMVLLEQIVPKHKAWLPSATGIGLGLILPFQYPLSMFVGAVIALVWTRRYAKNAEDYLVPVAAGLIAGISIMGVLVAVLNSLVFA